MAHGTALRTPEKTAIIADYLLGMSQADIAAKHGRHRATIQRVCREMREAPTPAEAAPHSVAQIRNRLVGPAVDTLHAAISDRTDVYKAGGLAVQTLKGCGVFALETTPTINAIMMQTPKEWHERYITIEGEAKDVTQE